MAVDARADADAKAGRVVSHAAVKRWIGSRAAGKFCRDRKSATELRRIVWTDEAIAHLEAIVAYISAFNPAAAARLGERLIAVADSLAEFFERGRDAGDGRREMTTVCPYVLRYRVEGERVVVLRIRHGARDEEEQQDGSLALSKATCSFPINLELKTVGSDFSPSRGIEKCGECF